MILAAHVSDAPEQRCDEEALGYESDHTQEIRIVDYSFFMSSFYKYIDDMVKHYRKACMQDRMKRRIIELMGVTLLQNTP